MKPQLFLLLLLPLVARAQAPRPVVIYFDVTKLHPHEVFRAFITKDTVMEGPYKRFYRNGRLEAQTRYTNGQRDSSYVEFHPGGQRRLEATYRAGVRQGPFKTYYPGGKVAQEGTFIDDEPGGQLTTYYPTGEIKLQTTLTKGQPSGTLRELYASGQPASEQEYANGQANGTAKFYYPSGKLQSEGTMHAGLLSGSYKTYYETGQLESETLINDKTGRGSYRSFYATGQLLTEGTYAPGTVRERAVKNQLGDNLTKRSAPRIGTAALDGPATSYYVSGKVRGKTTYRGGAPTGHGVEYFEDGQLKEEIDYANQGQDRRVMRYYDTPGQPRAAEEQYKNDKPFGDWRELYADGKTPRQTETYAANGKLLGELLTYFESGKVQSRLNYDVTGALTSTGQEYYANGQLRKEANYQKGLLNGAFTERHEDGTPTVLGQYKFGKQSGEWTHYKADGRTVDRKVTYRDGRPVVPGAGTRSRLNGKPYVAPKKK